MYLDSAYIAKFYVNEHDSPAVRKLIRKADALVSSAWAQGEVACAFHRHMRDGSLDQGQFHELLRAFSEHVEAGLWCLIPVTDGLLRRTVALVSSAPAGVYLRAGDAVHLATALDADAREVWTSDRHMLAAAPHFGLTGRTV
ncbi:MAG TPA: type II toxin-antitoxin system VapC family toxin [Bryobacteraceae bacterium]|nr:type II toxin-antitoxin system VapC family toxin [Bryobacteraceae bacterium]